MKALAALGGGLAGACAVTLIHETVRRIVPEAPRMDLLGMQAISRTMKAAGKTPPSDQKLFSWAMAGDIVSNSLYYSLAGIGKEKNVWIKSSLLGLAAGIGAVTLPGPLGLKEKYSKRTVTTQVMTVGLYVAGSLITTAVMKLIEHQKQRRQQQWEQRLMTSGMS